MAKFSGAGALGVLTMSTVAAHRWTLDGKVQLQCLTNRRLFSVVCSLIDNDMRHHSGQTLVDSRGAALYRLRYTTFDLCFTTIST